MSAEVEKAQTLASCSTSAADIADIAYDFLHPRSLVYPISPRLSPPTLTHVASAPRLPQPLRPPPRPPFTTPPTSPPLSITRSVDFHRTLLAPTLLMLRFRSSECTRAINLRPSSNKPR